MSCCPNVACGLVGGLKGVRGDDRWLWRVACVLDAARPTMVSGPLELSSQNHDAQNGEAIQAVPRMLPSLL